MTGILKELEVLSAIVGIIILEVYALSKGINGLVMSLCIAAIAGLGGYKVKEYAKSIKKG